ncbi:hypothetical protein [Phycicoccus flavus]|uniref:hypothetical protein n=1 Tax=Phycicoccus flavus TaxID=2502783 RepID=UPI000FEC15E2|nr:hypothetical protein [Phycicoccus flavus]NHA67068.1 hypothetical protein [Phycicoccus flavus]
MSAGMTAQRWSDDVGSVAEEAGRLLESLRRAGSDAAEAAAARGPAAGDPPAAGEASAEDRGSSWSAATGGEEPGPAGAGSGFTCEDPVCQWCPVCRASAFVRRLSPETLSGLAELAGFAATVLGDLASARARDAAARGEPTAPDGHPSAPDDSAAGPAPDGDAADEHPEGRRG